MNCSGVFFFHSSLSGIFNQFLKAGVQDIHKSGGAGIQLFQDCVEEIQSLI